MRERLRRATDEFGAIAAEGAAVLDRDDGTQISSRLAELTARWGRAMEELAEVLALDSDLGARAELGDYLALAGPVLSGRVLEPSSRLAGHLDRVGEADRFWELVRGAGGVLARTGPAGSGGWWWYGRCVAAAACGCWWSVIPRGRGGGLGWRRPRRGRRRRMWW